MPAKKATEPALEDWEGRLGVLNEEYEEAKDSGGTMPVGVHQASIVDARLTDQDWGLSMSIQFQNDVGQCTKFYNLEDRERMQYTKADLSKLGFPGPYEALLKWIESSEGPIGLVCEIKVVEKEKDGRTYQNTYINRVYGRMTDPSADGDDIPF